MYFTTCDLEQSFDDGFSIEWKGSNHETKDILFLSSKSLATKLFITPIVASSEKEADFLFRNRYEFSNSSKGPAYEADGDRNKPHLPIELDSGSKVPKKLDNQNLSYNRDSNYSHKDPVSSDTTEDIYFIRFPSIELIEYLAKDKGVEYYSVLLFASKLSVVLLQMQNSLAIKVENKEYQYLIYSLYNYVSPHDICNKRCLDACA